MSIKLKKKMPKNTPFMSNMDMEMELEFDTVEEMEAYFELEKRAFEQMMGGSACECDCDCYDDEDEDHIDGQVSFEELIRAIRTGCKNDLF